MKFERVIAIHLTQFIFCLVAQFPTSLPFFRAAHNFKNFRVFFGQLSFLNLASLKQKACPIYPRNQRAFRFFLLHPFHALPAIVPLSCFSSHSFAKLFLGYTLNQTSLFANTAMLIPGEKCVAFSEVIASWKQYFFLNQVGSTLSIRSRPALCSIVLSRDKILAVWFNLEGFQQFV